MSGNPGLIFNSVPVSTFVGTATVQFMTPGQATQAGNLLVMPIAISQTDPAASVQILYDATGLDAGFTILGPIGTTNSSLLVAYKKNCLANEGTFRIVYTQPQKATVMLAEYSKIVTDSDPLIVGNLVTGTENETGGQPVTASTSPTSVDAGCLMIFIAANTFGAGGSSPIYTTASGYTKGFDQNSSNTAQMTLQWRLGTQPTGIQAPTISALPGVGSAVYRAAILAFSTIPQSVPPTVDVKLTGSAPNVQFTASSRPNSGAVGLSGALPVVRASLPVNPASVVLQGSTPIVSVGSVSRPQTGTISVQGQAGPTLTVIVPVPLTPSTGAITLAGTNSLTRTTLTPVTGFIIYAGLSPPMGLTITPPSGAIALQGYAAAFNTNIVTGTGALALAGTTPSFIGGTGISPSTGAIALTGVPSTTKTTVMPGTGAITLAVFTPGQRINFSRIPPAAQLVLTGNSPGRIGQLFITPFVGSINLAGTQAGRLANTVRAPVVGALTLAPTAPQLNFGTLLIPPAATITLVGSSQNVSPGITPNTGSLALTGAVAQSLSSTVFIPVTGALNFAGTVPLFKYGFGITPNTAALTLATASPLTSTTLTPSTGTISLDGQSRVIPVFKTPGAAQINVVGGITFVGTDTRVYGLELSER